MTQSSTLSSVNLTTQGTCNPIIDAQSSVANAVNTYHQAGYAIVPYLIEGQQWTLDAMMNAAATVMYATNYNYSRSAVLGSTTYYGLLSNKEGNVRVQAWNKRTQGYAAKFSPATWSDGAANVEQSYIQYCLKNQFDYLFALVSFIGSVKFGPGSTASNKTKDFSGTGVWPEAFSVTSAFSQEITVPFMDDYEMQVCALLAYLWKGTATGTSIATWRDYFKNYYVKLWAYAGSHYLNDSYRINAFAAAPPSDPADPTWSSEGNATTPKLAFAPGNNSQMTFVATNSTVTLNASIFVDHASTVRAANGSRIKLTNTNIASYGVTPGALPPEIDPTAWYYWKEITATSGQLCTDVGLTLPVTPSTSIGGKYFWVVPSNTLPTDTSGQGTYNGGTSNSGNSRIAAKLGTMRLCQAMGMADDANGNVTDAITNCAAIFNSVPGQAGYSADAQYGWDNVL
jgi:hypothetical protein